VFLKKKTIINLCAAIIIAVVSASILYKNVIVGDNLGEYGLFGIFLVSMLSHLTIIGKDLFVPAFLPLTVFYHPLTLGLAAGLGGAIGETTTYYWGRGIREALKKEQEKDDLARWIDKYGLLAILLVAASPLPDAPIVLLAGSARFPIKKFLMIEGIGKTIWYSFGAVLGGFLFTQLGNFMEGLILSLVIIIISTIFCIMIYWDKARIKLFKLVKRWLP